MKNIKRAILLTGFNNWGKTTHIYNLFKRKRFYYGHTYDIPGVNAVFTVESRSNDDFGEKEFVATVIERIKHSPDAGKNIFCAFCPSREPYNDSHRILTNRPFTGYHEIHLLLLQHKWDFHAELRIKEIKNYFSSVPNVIHFIVDADARHTGDARRQQAREAQIVSYLQSIYP